MSLLTMRGCTLAARRVGSHTLRRPSNSNSSSSFTCRRSSATTTAIQQKPLLKTTSWITLVKKRPVEYASIPCVAAFVGISTNWMGVKMLFYPIEYVGVPWVRWPDTPWGLFGWEGVVPTKTKQMAARLVKIVTERLLSLDEAFGRLDPNELTRMLLPAVEEAIRRDCGEIWVQTLRPVLPILLPRVLAQLQKKENIDQVLDLRAIVMDAFVRDKVVLVDLFQKVGRVELEFLVNSGFGFGLILGLIQMGFWAAKPKPWTLPVAGALVGYITNWIAIKLLFEPAEPVDVLGLFEVQGLFESRQVEVSDEFGDFMAKRVLSSSTLLANLASGGNEGELFSFLRRQLPYPIPSEILSAAVSAVADVAANPHKNKELHDYVTKQLNIEHTLATRLKSLSPLDFEDMLHPVFQEDEITLIAVGGVLGFVAGAAQTQLGWGGPGATRRALVTIIGALVSSAAFYFHQKYEKEMDEPLASTERPHLQRHATVVRLKDEWSLIEPAYR